MLNSQEEMRDSTSHQRALSLARSQGRDEQLWHVVTDTGNYSTRPETWADYALKWWIASITLLLSANTLPANRRRRIAVQYPSTSHECLVGSVVAELPLLKEDQVVI